MRIDVAKKAAALLERIEELENVVMKLERIKEGDSFKLSAEFSDPLTLTENAEIKFDDGHLSTEIFKQNTIDYAINNFNIELDELKEDLEKLES